MVKQLDETSTPEEMAQAARSLRLARNAAIVVALLAGLVAFLLIGGSFGDSPYAVVVLVLVAAGAYWLTNQVLGKVLPPR